MKIPRVILTLTPTAALIAAGHQSDDDMEWEDIVADQLHSCAEHISSGTWPLYKTKHGPDGVPLPEVHEFAMEWYPDDCAPGTQILIGSVRLEQIEVEGVVDPEDDVELLRAELEDATRQYAAASKRMELARNALSDALHDERCGGCQMLHADCSCDRDAEDGIDAEPDENPTEPEEGDYVLNPAGPLGGCTAVSVDGRHKETFSPAGDKSADDMAMEWILADMSAKGFGTSIWRMDDHGGYTLLTP